MLCSHPVPPCNIADLCTGRVAFQNDPSLRVIRPGSATRRPLQNLKPIDTITLNKQMVWFCWKTLHLTILLNRNR